ncbi:MAG TPA: ankyrin repeat domain-containing protein [Treponemataceae bacterium]|nr:ankyrin repeat domain-containing protein [Treponemataceae bacterium]
MYTCKYCHRQYKYEDVLNVDYCSVGCRKNAEEEERCQQKEKDEERDFLDKIKQQDVERYNQQQEENRVRYEDEQEENRIRYEEEQEHREEMLYIEQQRLEVAQTTQIKKIKYLCSAARSGDFDEVKSSLRDGNDPNGVKEYRPIHHAILGNQKEIVSYLINNADVDISLENDKGYNAYFYAILQGNSEIIRIIRSGEISISRKSLIDFLLECIERGEENAVREVSSCFNLNKDSVQDVFKKAYMEKLKNGEKVKNEIWSMVISSSLIEMQKEWEQQKQDELKKKKEEEEERIQQEEAEKKKKTLNELEAKLEFELHKYDKKLLYEKDTFDTKFLWFLLLIIVLVPGIVNGIYEIAVNTGWHRFVQVLCLPFTVLFTTVWLVVTFNQAIHESPGPLIITVTLICVGLFLLVFSSSYIYNFYITIKNSFRMKYNSNLKISNSTIDLLKQQIEELRSNLKPDKYYNENKNDIPIAQNTGSTWYCYKCGTTNNIAEISCKDCGAYK